MLLNGGEHDGVRILAPETVQLMTMDSLPADIRFALDMIGPQTGASFGLGFGVRTNPDFSFVPGAVGSFTWGGLWGTYFWIDPVEKLTAVQMIQVAEDSAPFARALRFLAYGALRDPAQASFTPPATPVTVDLDILASYAGTYDFGASISVSDKQASGSSYVGIGVEMAMQDGHLTARAPYPDGPAFRAGVAAGDIITHVDDIPINGLSFAQVQGMLRGQVDTPVWLKIMQQGQRTPADVTVVRKMLRTPGVQLTARMEDGRLVIESAGPWPILDFDMGKPIAVRAISNGEFYVDGGDHTRIAFTGDGSGKITGAILNPDPRAIKGIRIDE